MHKIPISGYVTLQPRLLLVSYRLIDKLGPGGKEIGGGTCRIEASTNDSWACQLNRILDGRLKKVTEVTPVF